MKEIDIIFNHGNILIIGMGITGAAVAKKMAELGNNIIAFDNNTGLHKGLLYPVIEKSRGSDSEILLVERNNADVSVLKNVDLVIASPGIPSDNIILSAALERKIPVWDELELSWQLMGPEQRKNTIAVTGTNGKTTVVSLAGTLMEKSGMKAVLCGNIGSPVIETFKIDKRGGRAFSDDTVRVIETSSFQLERTFSFKPGIGIILNITSDHIDRHRCIEEYADMKFRLFANQDSKDFAVVNMDDETIAKKITGSVYKHEGPYVVKYGIKRVKANNLWLEDDYIYYDFLSKSGRINIKGVLLKGIHNISNIMASSAPLLILGADPENIGDSIKNFKPLSHRMEYLGDVDGIRCINDSKSTNPDSTAAALKDFTKEVTLIMGGKDKNMEFGTLASLMDSAVNNLILIGDSANRIEKTFSRNDITYGIYRCKDLEEAVRLGFKLTPPGDVLLLSPGCASMDMFIDYKDRGNRFKKIVMSFNEKNG
jgi:UDP-N-acetylmuramoylalanine--D-glutamate ligase